MNKEMLRMRVVDTTVNKHFAFLNPGELGFDSSRRLAFIA